MRQALGPGALGKPRGSGWRGRWEGGSGWGTHVNPWLFYSNVWQNSLQIKKKKRKKKCIVASTFYHAFVHAKLLQSCPALCNPMDCSPPGSSVSGILQARILEWVDMPSSRGSSWLRDQNHISCGSCTAGRFFITELPGKPYIIP